MTNGDYFPLNGPERVNSKAFKASKYMNKINEDFTPRTNFGPGQAVPLSLNSLGDAVNEIVRLREALQTIADGEWMNCDCHNIAQQALKEQT